MLKKIFLFLIFLGFLALVVGGIAGVWAYNYVTRDLPDFHSVEGYMPPAVSTVLANDGTVVGEFYRQHRYPVKIKDVPPMVRNCFLAAEDASFYSHPGIDPISILRAVVKNVESGSASQGASTITQQVVKNLLLSSEKKLIRKAQEAILSYRIEKRLSKDDILEIYLNEIFFGNNAYGIKAAAQAYFHKELKDLTLAEASMLAGLPKAPSRYSPNASFPRAKRRQHYVLEQMVKTGFATRAEVDAAEKEEIKVYTHSNQNIFAAPYYVTEVRRVLGERWSSLDIDNGGYVIHTALDLKADALATRSMQRGLREIDKRRGWRGPIGSVPGFAVDQFTKKYGSVDEKGLALDQVYPALVTEVSHSKKLLHVSLGAARGVVELKDASWAKRRIDKFDAVTWIPPENTTRAGDVIEVSLIPPKVPDPKKSKEKVETPVAPKKDEFQLDQTPDIEGALALVDPFSGKVLTAIGGYSYKHSVFNRATQSWRQPGSSFKPIVYLTAVDQFNYTPATIVHDEPRTFKVGDEFWSPGNFDGKYMGPIPLQVALEHSRNLVSAEIVSKIGIDAVIRTARKLGITSKIGRNLSISLGAAEMTLLELVRAYGVFAAKGVLFPSTFVTRIEDRFGKVIYDFEAERFNAAQQAIDPTSAFIMAHMMKGVIQRGTAVRLQALKRPVAGKTGTTNDQMDGWFIGYTPEWVCGVWVGFDVKKEIGDKETGGRVAAPIFLSFMQNFLADMDKVSYDRLANEAKEDAVRLGIDYVPPGPLQPSDFTPPDGVDAFWMDLGSGSLTQAGAPNSVLEYFKKGTEPSGGSDQADSNAYLESPDL